MGPILLTSKPFPNYFIVGACTTISFYNFTQLYLEVYCQKLCGWTNPMTEPLGWDFQSDSRKGPKHVLPTWPANSFRESLPCKPDRKKFLDPVDITNQRALIQNKIIVVTLGYISLMGSRAGLSVGSINSGGSAHGDNRDWKSHTIPPLLVNPVLTQLHPTHCWPHLPLLHNLTWQFETGSTPFFF